MRRALLLAAALLATLVPTAHAAAPAPVGHVFVVVLENEDYASTFGANTKAPYLADELARSGQLLTQYYGIGHQSLPNYIALVSGQAPNGQTQSDCQDYTPFAGLPMADAGGQAVGQGCVYPAWVPTVADQLSAKGLSWKGYMEDMGTPCRHPALGARDDTQQARVGDQYAARHNPFVYFASLTGSPDCARNDVPLDRLPADLASADTTANLSFITPNLCNDGHDEPCVDGRPGGLVSADEWLRTWIPRILGSPAFRRDGMLVVTFDEAEGSPPGGDASACCGEQPGPNTINPGGPVPGPGGGRVGAVVVSPFTSAGSVNPTPYNHYALLRTIEDVFGLAHLGYAGQAGLRPFGDDVFPNAGSPVTPSPAPSAGAPAFSCAGAGRLTRAGVRARGRALRVQLGLSDGGAAHVTIAAAARSGRVVSWRVARFAGRTRDFTWHPRGLGRGIYVVELRAGASVRRFAVRLRARRLQVLAPFETASRCGLIRALRVARPAFAGASLTIRYRLALAEPAVLELRRGGRTVRRLALPARSGRHVARMPARGLPAGAYRLRLNARGESREVGVRRLAP